MTFPFTPAGPSTYERMVLAGLQRQPHIYQGTVPDDVVLQRRAANRRARRSRRINRLVRR